MSAVSQTIEDSTKGYTHIFEMDFFQANFSANIRKTIKRDGITLATDNANIQVNVNGSVQTDAEILQLEAQDPRVRDFMALVMEKATEKYNFPAEVVAASKTAKA